jgi:uncharacterized protein YidB (DUF937 family)
MADKTTQTQQHEALKGALAPQVVQQIDTMGIDWSKLIAMLNTLLPLILALLPKTPPGTAQPAQSGVPQSPK